MLNIDIVMQTIMYVDFLILNNLKYGSFEKSKMLFRNAYIRTPIMIAPTT